MYVEYDYPLPANDTSDQDLLLAPIAKLYRGIGKKFAITLVAPYKFVWYHTNCDVFLFF